MMRRWHELTYENRESLELAIGKVIRITNGSFACSGQLAVVYRKMGVPAPYDLTGIHFANNSAEVQIFSMSKIEVLDDDYSEVGCPCQTTAPSS